jgi:hypothetical protein
LSARVVSIGDALAALTEPWKPTDLARANNAVVRVVRLHSDFPWHHHREDENVPVVGALVPHRDARPGSRCFERGRRIRVRRLVEHRPVADSPASALLFEPAETRQYGEQG